jgi:hypothetical protein
MLLAIESKTRAVPDIEDRFGLDVAHIGVRRMS